MTTEKRVYGFNKDDAESLVTMIGGEDTTHIEGRVRQKGIARHATSFLMVSEWANFSSPWESEFYASTESRLRAIRWVGSSLGKLGFTPYTNATSTSPYNAYTSFTCTRSGYYDFDLQIGVMITTSTTVDDLFYEIIANYFLAGGTSPDDADWTSAEQLYGTERYKTFAGSTGTGFDGGGSRMLRFAARWPIYVESGEYITFSVPNCTVVKQSATSTYLDCNGAAELTIRWLSEGSPSSSTFAWTSPQTPTAATAGAAYSWTPAYTGTTPTDIYTIGLPAGVSINRATGEISGTLGGGTAGSYPLKIFALHDKGTSALDVTLTVS